MKFSTLLRSALSCLVLSAFLGGCSDEKPLTLDKDDARVAGFYCDYLLLSGVAKGGEATELPQLDFSDAQQINVLLVQHYLTRESFNRKSEQYKRNSALWREVLELVRLKIRNKTGAQQ